MKADPDMVELPAIAQLDAAALDRIMAAVAPADALALSAALERPWQTRQRRLAMRDHLVLKVLATTFGRNTTSRCVELALRLRRAAETSRCTDGAAVQIVALSDGHAALSWQHISRIHRESQSPDLCKISDSDAQKSPA